MHVVSDHVHKLNNPHPYANLSLSSLAPFLSFSLNILNDCVKKNIIGLQLRFDSPREKLCYHDNITALFLDCENSVFYLGFHFIHLNEIQGKIYSIFYLGCTEMFIAAT